MNKWTKVVFANPFHSVVWVKPFIKEDKSE